MTAAETGTRGSRRGELHRRRVLLLSQSAALGAMLVQLLDGTATLARFDSPREALQRDGLDGADTVVFDLPGEDSDNLLAQLRLHYHGELVVLADHGLRHGGAAVQPAWRQLARPFSADELGAALGVVPEDAPPRGPAATDHPAPAASTFGADPKAAAPRAPSWAQIAARQAGRDGFGGRVGSRLAALSQGWQAQRRVRVAGFSAFALVAFTVAFILAANDRCGPGCDALGTGFSSKPTIAASDSGAPSTSRSKRAANSTSAPVASAPGTGAVLGVSGPRLATATTTGERATTTTRRPGSGAAPPTTTPPTTTPPTTTPPTTVPPTTAPSTTPTTDPPPVT